ncbi:MAG: DUF6505 family protein [Aquisalimonadaceae bacterium]
MKFPRVARLDDTDEHVYTLAAEVGEPAVPGTFVYTFTDGDPAELQGKQKQAFRHAFLGTGSFGWATVVTVSDITEAEYKGVIEALAHHFVEHYGAPSLEAALPIAREEADYAAGLCEYEVNTVLALDRVVSGDGIHESFKVIKPRANWQGGEVRIWSMEEEDR